MGFCGDWCWKALLSRFHLAEGLIAVTGINALVKSNQLKDYVKHVVPSPTVVVINDNGNYPADLISPAWFVHILQTYFDLVL